MVTISCAQPTSSSYTAQLAKRAYDYAAGRAKGAYDTVVNAPKTFAQLTDDIRTVVNGEKPTTASGTNGGHTLYDVLKGKWDYEQAVDRFQQRGETALGFARDKAASGLASLALDAFMPGLGTATNWAVELGTDFVVGKSAEFAAKAVAPIDINCDGLAA